MRGDLRGVDGIFLRQLRKNFERTEQIVFDAAEFLVILERNIGRFLLVIERKLFAVDLIPLRIERGNALVLRNLVNDFIRDALVLRNLVNDFIHQFFCRLGKIPVEPLAFVLLHGVRKLTEQLHKLVGGNTQARRREQDFR